jgi:hypothetical protein
MKRIRKISSIEELRLEKEKLKLEMELTQKAFSYSLGSLGAKTRNFFFQKLLLPAGLSAIATFILKKWTDDEPAEGRQSASGPPPLVNLLKMLAEVVINYFQTSHETEPRSADGATTENQEE